MPLGHLDSIVAVEGYAVIPGRAIRGIARRRDPSFFAGPWMPFPRLVSLASPGMTPWCESCASSRKRVPIGADVALSFALGSIPITRDKMDAEPHERRGRRGRAERAAAQKAIAARAPQPRLPFAPVADRL